MQQSTSPNKTSKLNVSQFNYLLGLLPFERGLKQEEYDSLVESGLILDGSYDDLCLSSIETNVTKFAVQAAIELIEKELEDPR